MHEHDRMSEHEYQSAVLRHLTQIGALLQASARDLHIANVLERLEAKLERMSTKLGVQTTMLMQSANREAQMAGTLDDVLNEIREMPSINDSLDALFLRLQELIGSNNPAKIQEALDLVTAQKARTKAAIVANTPVASDVPPAP